MKVLICASWFLYRTGSQGVEIVVFRGLRADVLVYNKAYEVIKSSNILWEAPRSAGWVISQWLSESCGASAQGVSVATIERADFQRHRMQLTHA